MNSISVKRRIASIAIACGLGTTSLHAAPVQWLSSNGGNDHWYDFVTLPTAVADVEAYAESQVFQGQSGYLATITSAQEQAFLNSLWPGPTTNQFGNFYQIGLSDRDVEGEYRWIGGPEEGQLASYTNWASGEPNNFNGGEEYVVAFWNNSTFGAWNDTPDNSGSRMIIEYSGEISAVPIPAGLPLLLGGLGLLGFLRRKS